MSSPDSTRISAHARADAAEWFVVLQDNSDPGTREAFYHWLRRSPENVHAFLRITSLWEDAELLERSPLFDREALLRRARAEPGNIETLMPATSPARRRESRGPGLRGWYAVAATLLMTFAIITWLYTQRGIYSTDIGEQRTIALTDGSTIVLNSKSRVKVRFANDERNIDLVAGQAMFRVAHNPARPFIVHSGSTNIRAVGTQFDVYRKGLGTIVTVIEGKVAVEETPLAAGEQLTVSTTGSAKEATAPKRANVDAATAWTQGKLIFDETPLAEVVAEFNRYNSRQLIIDDADLRSFHVSGVFPSNDPTRVAELLRQRFDVTVWQSDVEIRITRN